MAGVFTGGSDDPIADLRQEGEPVARGVRDQLDAVSPGLGNPVMSVSVSVEDPAPVEETTVSERDALMQALRRIEGRLDDLRRCLPAD